MYTFTLHLGNIRLSKTNIKFCYFITLLALLNTEKDIRDRVLNAIYKEMGMAKKAKGIAFSLPVSDVAGLAPAVQPQEEN